MSTPWIEKYRPKTLSDVVGNTETIERLKEFSHLGYIPSVIISGPPGCGKTTSIWALARDMLGDNAKEAVLELNASDDRGIDTVRNKIKSFAQKKVTLPDGKHKIIILDEADSMTEGAQQALRRIMEIYSNTTRFAFACNQSDKIIEPLQSRCALVKYSKLSDEEMAKRVIEIAKIENLNFTEDGIEAILFTAQGDMRQALNNLQCTASGYGLINAENVYKVCDEPHPDLMRDLFENCAQGEFKDAFAGLDKLYKMGYSTDDILTTMSRVVKYIDVPEALKLEFIKEVAKTHTLAVQGMTGRVQLAGLAARLSKKQRELADASENDL
jgi:replication factor C subunit 2/4|uniref:AAA+ ATPase domain-containing protein n=1 Tax=Panagrolaimus sp. PS1159 TaxID=55785 RepID=A0AC35F4L3_9BILA